MLRKKHGQNGVCNRKEGFWVANATHSHFECSFNTDEIFILHSFNDALACFTHFHCHNHKFTILFLHLYLFLIDSLELRNKQQQSGLEWHFLRHFVKISLSFQREFTNSQFKIDNEKYYFIVFLFVNGLQQRISETISQIISCVLFCCLQINSIPQLFLSLCDKKKFENQALIVFVSQKNCV